MNFRLTLIGLAVVLAGCSSVEKRTQASGSKAYLDAQEGKPLQTSKAFQPSSTYAIPTLPAASETDAVGNSLDIRPPSLVLSIADNSRRVSDQDNAVEFLGSRDRRQTLDQMGDNLWQAMLDFVGQPGYALLTSDRPGNQLTVKATSGNDKSKVSKLFTRDAPVVEETFLLTFVEDTRERAWVIQAELTGYQSTRAELTLETLPVIERQRAEANLLNDFGAYYDALQDDLRNAETAISDRILIKQGADGNGLPAFIADAGFDPVWQRLPQALEGVGFDVNDRNRALGTYFIAYSPPLTKSFSLFGKAADEDEPEIKSGDYSVQVGLMGSERTSITFLGNGDKPLSEDELSQFYTKFAELMRSPTR